MRITCYLLLLSIILLSCNKDENNEPIAKHEFTTYLIDKMSIKDHPFDEKSSSYEIGWVFDSQAGGKVIELGGLFPEAGTYKVTLWNAETSAIIAQTEVTATAGTLAMKKIDAVTLEANKDYVVSYNTYSVRDYYWLQPEESIFPLKLGDITVYGEVEENTYTANPVFPGTNTTTSIVGVPEIGFIKN